MTESKLNTFTRNTDEVFDTPVVRRLIEDHMQWLLSHPESTNVVVTPHQLHVYEFDWLGLLVDLSLPLQNAWTIIRMNGGQSYTDVPQNINTLIVPPQSAVARLVELQYSGKRAA